MATTSNTITATAGQTEFSFSFPYLKKESIKVTIDTVATTAFTIPDNNPTTVILNSGATAGQVIKIFRLTSTEAVPAAFFAGGAIRSKDLNNNFDSILYITQERENQTDEIIQGGIADGSITSSKLANNSVGTAALIDGGVATVDLADDAVTTPKIVNDAVTTPKIVNDAVTTAKIVNDAVSTPKIIDNAVSTPKIINDAVTTVKIADANVTTAKIADDAVTLTKLENNVTGKLGNRNKIINGEMRIAQRGTSPVTTNGAYVVDRFRQFVDTQGAVSFQRQKADVPAGFNYALKAVVTTADATTDADNTWGLSQTIESDNLADLMFGTANAKPVTLSFWVKSSVAGVYCATVRNNEANNSADVRCFVSEYTINSANTWEYKTITVTGDTTGTWDVADDKGLVVIFSLTGGTNKQGTAGSWGGYADCSSNQTQLLETLNATWFLTGVQLEMGANATPFEYRDYAQEIIRCQRYFRKEYCNIRFSGGAYAEQALSFPPMRVAPTVTNTTNTSVGLTFLSFLNITDFGCRVSALSNTAGDAYALSQVLHLSAEF